jgi:hypothetical protein
MTTEFSKLDKAKLDLIRLKNKHEELSDMTLRDQTQIQFLEDEMEKKEGWIEELQQEKVDSPVETMRRDMETHNDNVINLKDLF